MGFTTEDMYRLKQVIIDGRIDNSPASREFEGAQTLDR